MHVDVDLAGRKVNEEDRGGPRVALAPRVRLAQRIRDGWRGGGSPVHEDILLPARRRRQVGVMERIIHPIKVINIMEESYCDPDFSIYVLADKFHISVAYMSYLFKKEFDQNFSDYLWSLRLKKAKELLTQTKLSIDEVSIKVGYITPSGFRRKFKRDVGVSPTQYREAAQEN